MLHGLHAHNFRLLISNFFQDIQFEIIIVDASNIEQVLGIYQHIYKLDVMWFQYHGSPWLLGDMEFAPGIEWWELAREHGIVTEEKKDSEPFNNFKNYLPDVLESNG